MFKFFVFVCVLTFAATLCEGDTLISLGNPTFLERLAAKELRRYIYLRTKKLPIIVNENDTSPHDADLIIIGTKDRSLVQKILAQENLNKTADLLHDDSYLIKTLSNQTRTVLITGGTPISILYGAYRFIEKMGVGFYLEGDVIPDEPINQLPLVDEVGSSLFAIRGILPYHDFAEGPDWWNADSYQLVTGQLPKLRFSFMGLHTYSSDLVEPQVWIGSSSNGTFAYPASMHTTARTSWGYIPKATGNFYYGASRLFERDSYGSNVMEGFEPYASTAAGQQEVFARSEKLINLAFTHARALGVKTATGIELPLWKPPGLEKEDSSELFKGIFNRIIKNYPLDYFWLWTQEGWTWGANSKEEAKTVVKEILQADAILKSMGQPFGLATGGWVLGPTENRALLDEELPQEIPLSSLNRNVGFDPIDPSYANVKRKNKWASPWLEDDPGLTSPQLWVRRIKREVNSAQAYNLNGLFAGHWRTRNIGPQLSALSKWTWNYGTVLHPFEKSMQSVGEFYKEWAQVNFGTEAAEPISKIFSAIDGNLPRTSTWVVNGPGGVEKKHLILKECRNFAVHDVRCPTGEGFASVYGRTDIGGWAKGAPAVAEFSDRLIIAARAEGDKIIVKEWRDGDIKHWYFVQKFKTISEPKLLLNKKKLWMYAQGHDDFIHRCRFINKGHWTNWEKTVHHNSEFGESGPHFAAASFGVYEVSNPSLEEEFWFVDALSALRSSVKGPGNLERFDYWLNNFQYMKAIGGLRASLLDYDREFRGHGQKNIKELLKIRKEIISQIALAYHHLLSVVSSSGEMGTLANWEQHILPVILDGQTKSLEKLLGSRLPAEYMPSKVYAGETRIILPAVPTSVGDNSDYELKALILSTDESLEPELYWRALGSGSAFQKLEFTHVNRGVFKVTLSKEKISSEDFEFFVKAGAVVSDFQTVVVEPVSAPTSVSN